MPNALQRLFLPLYRAAHWPDEADYLRDIRGWVLDHLLEHARTAGAAAVVEVGCGDGWISHRLAARFPRVLAFDINPARLLPSRARYLVIAAAGAERPPVADRSADLVISMEVLEHVVDRVGVLRALCRLLRPGGQIIITVPVATWKVLQFAGFIPHAIRKQARGLTRWLAGQKKSRVRKYRPAAETNHPFRPAPRKWYRKLVPRVHGEYDSHWREFRAWSPRRWEAVFREAGLCIVYKRSSGLHSPYGFGFKGLARWAARLGLGSGCGWVLEPAAPGRDDAATRC
jgi:SAM-dependent methyltransferase